MKKESGALIAALLLPTAFLLVQSVLSAGDREASLSQAIEKSSCSEIYALLDGGADISSRDDIGATPLMRAVEQNLPRQCVRLLLRSGADPNATHGPLEISVLMIAASYSTAEVVSLLLQSGADVRLSTPDGWTALMSAARNSSRPAVIQTIVTAGANIDARDQYGVTPLMRAAQTNPNPELLETLVRLGADVEIRTPDGHTAYDLARQAGVCKKVLALLEPGSSSEPNNN